MDNFIAVNITARNLEEASMLAHVLVEERLIACASMFPVRSVYSWKGNIENQEEVMIVCKTERGRFEKLVARVKALHSYEVPEIIALPIEDGSADYMDWLRQNTRK